MVYIWWQSVHQRAVWQVWPVRQGGRVQSRASTTADGLRMLMFVLKARKQADSRCTQRQNVQSFCFIIEMNLMLDTQSVAINLTEVRRLYPCLSHRSFYLWSLATPKRVGHWWSALFRGVDHMEGLRVLLRSG